jgi:hypothetical protein
MQGAQHIPIRALPGPAAIMERQIEERENGIVDPVSIDLHWRAPKFPNRAMVAAFFSQGNSPGCRTQQKPRRMSAAGLFEYLVAGAGFEPAAFRL